MATKTTTPSKKTSKKANAAPAKTPKAKAPKAASTPPKPDKATKPAPAPKSAKPAKTKKVSGLDLAAKVLAEAGEPLAAKTIAERVIAAGWQTSGATPHATLYSAMTREITTKGKDARFQKIDRGLFQATAPTTNGKGK